MKDLQTLAIEIPVRKKRDFISENFLPDTWEAIAPYCDNLFERNIQSLSELNTWLRDWDELGAAISEHSRWIYVRTTIDTTDEKAKTELIKLYTQIQPKLTVENNKLEKKLVECPFTEQLNKEKFFTTIRKIKNSLSLFCEKNIPLLSEMQLKQNEYDTIIGAQSITYNGVEITMQQAGAYLKSTDRNEREVVYRLMDERRKQDAEKLDNLFSELIQLRHQQALNAGFKNYVEYRFAELDRFDYTPADCKQFHSASVEVIMPIVHELSIAKQKAFGYSELKPWDKDSDPYNRQPLRPCENSNELLEKTIACFGLLDPYFKYCLEVMRAMKYLDLESRMGKGPGGYNMTMPEIGVPFIFMNSANSEHDLITMVHEGGHAIHTFLAHELELNMFKDTTSEIAEVASMGMELMSMEHWDVFYQDADDVRRAKVNHLQYILSVLTKTCMGDSFQFWLYENPHHTIADRRQKWSELHEQYSPANIKWDGYEDAFATSYHSILHFFVVPFYYIEYAFAQLGAIALWRNFKLNRPKAINDYKSALKLGYTKPIPAFYETAGAKFDFSKKYVAELVRFLNEELAKLN